MPQRPRLAAAAVLLASAAGGAVGAVLVGGSSSALRGTAGVCNGVPGSYWDYVADGKNWNVGQCCEGRGQSPKNMTAVATTAASGNTLFWGFHVLESPITMRNTGRVLSVKIQANTGGIFVGTEFPKGLVDSYAIWKIEIHTPSEHTFEGAQVPLELQIFHRKRGVIDEEPIPEDVAIVSLGFVGGGQPSPFLDALRQGGLPQQVGEERLVNKQAPASLNFLEIFGQGRSAVTGAFWEYTGSLTAPPCSSGIKWFVRSDPLIAFPATLAEFKQAVMAITPLAQKKVGNARALQAPCGASKRAIGTKDISSTMDTAFDKLVDPTFQAAVSKAAAEKAAFEKSLVRPPPLYERCMDRLAMAARELTATKARREKSCGSSGVGKARAELEANAGDGIRRLSAGSKLNGQKALCAQATSVFEALTAELNGGRERCEKLKPGASAGGLFGS